MNSSWEPGKVIYKYVEKYIESKSLTFIFLPYLIPIIFENVDVLLSFWHVNCMNSSTINITRGIKHWLIVFIDWIFFYTQFYYLFHKYNIYNILHQYTKTLNNIITQYKYKGIMV